MTRFANSTIEQAGAGYRCAACGISVLANAARPDAQIKARKCTGCWLRETDLAARRAGTALPGSTGYGRWQGAEFRWKTSMNPDTNERYEGTVIGTCDCCNARDVELSRSFPAGLETWACADGCKHEAPAEKATFTRKLSFDEQRELTIDQQAAYWDWLFAFNEPAVRKREREQAFPNRDWDKERAIRNDEDYESFPSQQRVGA